jgi:hypothetical protein
VVLPARAYALEVRPTVLGGAAILSSTPVQAVAGTLTRVFVVGNPAIGYTAVVVQHLTLAQIGAVPPTSVHTGDAGLAAVGGLPPVVGLVLGLLVVLVFAGAGAAGGRNRAAVALGVGSRVR